MTVPTLTTQRLTLRGPEDSDAGPLGAFLESPRAEWIGGPYPATEAMEWVEYDRQQWAERGRGAWIAALPDETPVGRVGYLDHDGRDESELAWFLFDGFEGSGCAYEAAIAARSYAADVLKLPLLFSFVEAHNIRSRALALRLGAAPERDVVFNRTALTVYRHPGVRR